MTSAAPPARPVRRFSRVMRVLIPVGILAVILVTVTTVGFVEFSGRPSFCKTCHIMQPYYDSWATSSHRDVACIKCHYAPGIRAEAMGKFQAANQVVKYVTGAYGMKPWAEIEDAACLRSGCHSERKVEGVVDYKGVPFDHASHLGELRRGKQLRCTSCHSQIVQGQHLAVTEATCILCHFKGRPPGAPVGGCTGCHPAPPRIESPGGYVVDHSQYVRDRISCLSCHGDVTTGAGAAERERCFNCHNEPARLEQFDNTTLMHQTHIAEHKVECTQCHTPIEHRIVALAATFELDCRSCHTQVHDAQRRLYAGMGGHDARSVPSKMYLARVACVGCHGQPLTLPGHERVRVAGEASCLSCHGVRYANLLPSWQTEMERKIRRVEPIVAGARAALGAVPGRQRVVADSLLRQAQENLDLVRVGKPAHNVVFSDELLRAAVDLVRDAVKAGRLPYAVPAVSLGPAVGANACLSCHVGVERSKRSFQGAAFDHEPHVVRAGLGCVECHTTLDQHGGTTIASRAACDGCHHSAARAINCTSCHAGPGGVPDQTFQLAAGDFSHGVHRQAGLACTACHQAPAMSARELNCDNCHDQHHQPDRACLSCHRDGVYEQHTRVAHVACAECHESAATLNRWSPQICTTCHVDKATGHNPGKACEMCHQVPPMESGG